MYANLTNPEIVTRLASERECELRSTLAASRDAESKRTSRAASGASPAKLGLLAVLTSLLRL